LIDWLIGWTGLDWTCGFTFLDSPFFFIPLNEQAPFLRGTRFKINSFLFVHDRVVL
jgi:hypothetical protein